MGKQNIKGQKNRKKNKEKNSKKKKRAKFKSHNPDQEVFGKNKEASKKTALSLKVLCEEFSRLNHTASTRDIVRAKQRRDRRVLDKDLKNLCKTMNSMCHKEETKEDEEEECFAEVEDLAKNVNDLIISNNDNLEPGFRFTRWQQRKFHQNVRTQKIKYNYNNDDDADGLNCYVGKLQ